MNNEFKRIWNEVVMAQFKVLFQHFPGGTDKKTMKNLSRDSRSLSCDLNQRPPKYEAGVLTICCDVSQNLVRRCGKYI
jgi:hypothetical protein